MVIMKASVFVCGLKMHPVMVSGDHEGKCVCMCVCLRCIQLWYLLNMKASVFVCFVNMYTSLVSCNQESECVCVCVCVLKMHPAMVSGYHEG